MNVLFLDDSPLYNDTLPAGLEQLGCTVRILKEVLNGRLEQELAQFHPDFALTMGWSEFPTQERLKVIRETLERHGIPLVYWASEDPCWHERWSVPYVKTAQPALVLTICEEYVPRYEELGFKAACLPFGFNHRLYRPAEPKPEYFCDVAVVANFYMADYHELNRKRSMEDLVSPLLERGYNMKIWGKNWDRAAEFGVALPEGVWQGYLDHREAPAVYRSARIVLGVQNEFDFATNLTMRTCEVMGSLGFLLTSRTLAVQSMFEDGKHLVMSGSPEETLGLMDHYLARPEARAEIAAAGREEVLRRHTYEHRALKLLDLVGQLQEAQMVRVAYDPVPLPLKPYCPDDSSSSSSHQSPCDDGSESPCDDTSGSTGSDGSGSTGSGGSDWTSGSDHRPCTRTRTRTGPGPGKGRRKGPGRSHSKGPGRRRRRRGPGPGRTDSSSD